MEERYGRYGLTRRQRNAWLIIICACSVLGAVAALLSFVGLVTGHETLSFAAAPFMFGFFAFSSIVLWFVLGGPPRGSGS